MPLTSIEKERIENSLLQAAIKGDFETAQMLIAQGANIKATDDEGNTLLHYSLNSPKLTEYLLQQGLSPNAKNIAGVTPVHKAAASAGYHQYNAEDPGEIDFYCIIALLKKYGATNEKDSKGRDTTYYASHEDLSQGELVKSILSGGEDYEYYIKLYGETGGVISHSDMDMA